MSTEDGFTVRLRPVDADAILAMAEWALNHPDLELGPGLHKRNAEEACRRIESVADMMRRASGTWESGSFTLPEREAEAVPCYRGALLAIKGKCEAQGQTVLAAEIGRIAGDALAVESPVPSCPVADLPEEK